MIGIILQQYSGSTLFWKVSLSRILLDRNINSSVLNVSNLAIYRLYSFHYHNEYQFDPIIDNCNYFNIYLLILYLSKSILFTSISLLEQWWSFWRQFRTICIPDTWFTLNFSLIVRWWWPRNRNKQQKVTSLLVTTTPLPPTQWINWSY